jgi:type VI secretion system protein ImpL
MPTTPPPAASPAPLAAAPAPSAAPTAAPEPPLFDRIPWTLVIVIAIIVIVVAVAIWLGVRWWRRRNTAARPAAQPAAQPAIGGQLAAVWSRFYRRLPARARHFPTVLVMGLAGSGKSHLIDARVDWRSQANQFFPSSVDSPLLQLYLGSDVVVHELAATLLHDIRRGARRALARLWRHLGPSATIVVVVDARALSTTPPDTLRELAQLVRGKIGALPARCRAGVEVRVCLSHMDQIDGYEELVAVVGAHHRALDITALGERSADAAGVFAAAQALMARYDANLAYGLAHRTSDAFARLVGFYSRFPVLLTQLAPLLRSLRGDAPDQPHYTPSDLFLAAVVPDSHVGDPFAVDHSMVAASIAHQRRVHRLAGLSAVAGGLAVVGALMWWHDTRLTVAETEITRYSGEVTGPNKPGEARARKAGAELARMHRSERLWLGHSFLERKRVLEQQFAKALRDQYVLPKLRVWTVNRSTMLYLVALLYASDDNGLRALIRENLDLWASKVELPSDVVTAYLDVSRERYETMEWFDPVYSGSDAQSYIFERIKPMYEQPQRLSQAQLDALKGNPPQLYDEREYAVRASVVDLLHAEVALATHPPIAKLLASPLGLSEWVQTNLTALRGITAAMARNQLAPVTPRTLGQLGTELERILSVPSTGTEVYRLSRETAGNPESLTFDVAAWHRKLAEASAALTIAGVRDRNLADPDQALGFFPAGEAPRKVGIGAGAQGATRELPDEYTAATFARQVAPALDFITTRAGGLGLSLEEQAVLGGLYREQIEDYASRYARALHDYYHSFHFEPGSEDALPFALTAMVQPSSWFLRFLTTVSSNATPALGDGTYYAVMADRLSEFRTLSALLAPAKGTIPGLQPYQQIIDELAVALAPVAPAPAAPDDGAAAIPATLASSLSRTGGVALNKLTGADKDRRIQISGWLTGANVDSDLHAPFLAAVDAVYAYGNSAVNRAVHQAWNAELYPLISPLLARSPFRPGARSDVAIAELDAVLRAQGKQPGAFWTGFARWLAPVTALRSGRYQWLAGVSGPPRALDTINDLARLSRALWDAEGDPSALPIEIVPQPLDAAPSDGRVPILAYLRSGASAVYAFNQRPGPSTLALQWWDQGVTSIIIKLRKPGSADTEIYSIDESESPFSLFRLLCRARRPGSRSGQPTPATCEPGRGPRIWDIPITAATTRTVTLTLDTDPWALFHIAH